MQSSNDQTAPYRGHVPALDGVRGTAAAMVFVFHYGGGAQSSNLLIKGIGTIIHFGAAGVSLFFALSGFLISGILWDGFKRPNWWRRFYARRAFRIFPLYYLALVIAVVVWLAIGVKAITIWPVLLYALYLGDVPALAKQLYQLPDPILLNHFWSLAVEEQFYLIWPFVLVLFAGKRQRAMQMIAVLWTASLLYRVVILVSHFSMDWSALFLLGRSGELLAGAYLAMMIRGNEEDRRWLFKVLPAVMFISALLIVAVCFAAGSNDLDTPLMSTVGLSLCSIFFTSIVGLSLQPGILQSFFSNPFLRWLGKISYGIYVYHFLLHHVFIYFTVWIIQKLGLSVGHNGIWIMISVVGLVGTLAIASLSFYTFESYFLRWKERAAR